MWSRWVGPILAILLLALGGAVRADVAGEAGENAECEHGKLNTQDATPVDPGSWEIDFGYEMERARQAFSSSWATTGRPILREREFDTAIQYGLVPDLSIAIAAGEENELDRSEGNARSNGLTDLTLSAKWRFYYDAASRLSIAYVPALSLPTGSSVADRYASLYNGVALSKDWTSRLTSDFDVGYAYPFGGPREGYCGTLSADAALGYHVTPWLQPEIELNYAHDFLHGGDGDLLSVTAGLIMPLSDHLKIGVGVQQPVAGRNEDKSTSLLATVAISF